MTRASLVGNRDAPVMDDRGIEDLMDQLDVFIAQREFDEAVDSIKKGWVEDVWSLIRQLIIRV